MAGHEPWNNPKDFLYHYTTTEGLIGIITSGQIWLTNAGFLNDSQEITYGAKRAGLRLRNRAEKLRATPNDCETNRHIAEHLEAIATSIESINAPGNERFEFPYIASFSEERDDLSQWRGYAEGGYCIAFHREALRTYLIPAGENVIPGIGQNIPILEKVQYGDETESHIEEYVDLTIQGLTRNGSLEAPQGIDTYHMIKRIIAPALITTKHPAFKAENEWRIHLTDIQSLSFRASPQGPVPYTQVHFDGPAIAEIMVSPGDYSNRRARAAEELLFHNRYESVPVTTSIAPYVG